jgi:hypothetical protein
MTDARIIDSPEKNAEKNGTKSVNHRPSPVDTGIAAWDITSMQGHKQLRLLIFL